MTESLEPGVVVPYSRFLECAERRRVVALELAKRSPFSGADVPPVPDQPPTPIKVCGCK